MRHARGVVAAYGIVVAVASACGGKNDDGPAALGVYLSGTWSVQEVATTGNCTGTSYPQVRSYSALLSQTGNDLVGAPTVPGPSWSGTVSGTIVSWTASRPESGGTLAIVFSGTAGPDGNTLSGPATWTWTGSGYTCNGTATVTGTRTAVATAFGTWADVSARAGNSQATVSWARVVGAARYRLYRSTTPDVAPIASNAVVTLIASVPPFSWTDGWLTNETPYYYVMTAVSSDGTESAPSPVTAVTPSSALPRPATPSILSVTPSSRSVTITHSAVANATTYQLYYSAASDLTSYPSLHGHLGVISNSISTIGIGNLTAGTTYWFAVTARNLDGESEPSAMVSATPTP